jgi:hypothetical protein
MGFINPNEVYNPDTGCEPDKVRKTMVTNCADVTYASLPAHLREAPPLIGGTSGGYFYDVAWLALAGPTHGITSRSALREAIAAGRISAVRSRDLAEALPFFPASGKAGEVPHLPRMAHAWHPDLGNLTAIVYVRVHGKVIQVPTDRQSACFGDAASRTPAALAAMSDAFARLPKEMPRPEYVRIAWNTTSRRVRLVEYRQVIDAKLIIPSVRQDMEAAVSRSEITAWYTREDLWRDTAAVAVREIRSLMSSSTTHAHDPIEKPIIPRNVQAVVLPTPAANSGPVSPAKDEERVQLDGHLPPNDADTDGPATEDFPTPHHKSDGDDQPAPTSPSPATDRDVEVKVDVSAAVTETTAHVVVLADVDLAIGAGGRIPLGMLRMANQARHVVRKGNLTAGSRVLFARLGVAGSIVIYAYSPWAGTGVTGNSVWTSFDPGQVTRLTKPVSIDLAACGWLGKFNSGSVVSPHIRVAENMPPEKQGPFVDARRAAWDQVHSALGWPKPATHG